MTHSAIARLSKGREAAAGVVSVIDLTRLPIVVIDLLLEAVAGPEAILIQPIAGPLADALKKERTRRQSRGAVATPFVVPTLNQIPRDLIYAKNPSPSDAVDGLKTLQATVLRMNPPAGDLSERAWEMRGAVGLLLCVGNALAAQNTAFIAAIEAESRKGGASNGQ